MRTYNTLTKTLHHLSLKGTFHDPEDSQFSTKANFSDSLTMREEERNSYEFYKKMSTHTHTHTVLRSLIDIRHFLAPYPKPQPSKLNA